MRHEDGSLTVLVYRGGKPWRTERAGPAQPAGHARMHAVQQWAAQFAPVDGTLALEELIEERRREAVDG